MIQKKKTKTKKKKLAKENMDWLECQELLIRCLNFDFTIWFRASLVTGTFEKQALGLNGLQ